MIEAVIDSATPVELDLLRRMYLAEDSISRAKLPESGSGYKDRPKLYQLELSKLISTSISSEVLSVSPYKTHEPTALMSKPADWAEAPAAIDSDENWEELDTEVAPLTVATLPDIETEPETGWVAW